MNIYLKELKDRWKSTLIWSLSMLAYVAMSMVKFEAGASAAGSMEELLKAMPQSLQNLMGTSLLDLGTPMGFFTAAFPYLLLVAGIHGGILGAGILAREERDRTTEFLATRPISREGILLPKLLAALTLSLIYSLSTTFFSLLVLQGYGPLDPDLFLLMGGFMALDAFFLLLGFFLAAFLPRPRLAVPLASALVLFFFLLMVVGEMTGSMALFSWLTPFAWFDGKALLGLTEPGTGPYILALFLAFLLSLLSFFRYPRRDLYL